MSVRKSDAATGKRDRLVQMVPITQGRATSGFPTKTPTSPVDVWAAKDDLGGRERIVMNQESAPYDTRWILPFSDAWNPNTVEVPKVFKLTHQGRDYDIVHAAEVGRRMAVEILTMARHG